jgi:co-chaperonin GroES (HSP10)
MAFQIEAKGQFVIAVPSATTDEKFAKVESAPKQQYLEVIAVGDEVDRCKPGDKILPYGSEFQAFPFEGKQYIVLTNEQVLGVFNV